MTLDPWTLALEAGNFLVLVFLLHRFLYRPVLAIIAERRQTIATQLEAAADARQAAEALADERRTQLDAIEDERLAHLDEDRAEIDDERREILDAARDEAAELRRAVRAELARERDDAFDAVRERAAELAAGVAERLLREARFESAAEPFLERAAEHLADMDPDERARLLGGGDATVLVTTAPGLDHSDRDRWRDRLVELLGAHTSIAFASDDALVAGCELRFAAGVIRFAWGPALERARAELTRHVDAA